MLPYKENWFNTQRWVNDFFLYDTHRYDIHRNRELRGKILHKELTKK